MNGRGSDIGDRSLHPDTRMGIIALAVADLERSIQFYRDVLGFSMIEHEDGGALLGAGATPLLSLVERRGAVPAPVNATGLYHFAILYPGRAELAVALRRLLEAGYPLDGASDHLVSEALYLSDPDGNGIELYRDRPRDTWQWRGDSVQMTVDPLDLRGLLSEAGQTEGTPVGLPEGTTIGHVHLKVADLRQAGRFYHGVIGFDPVATLPSALFVSAGGYHHHLGLNTWHSRGTPPPPPESAGLRYFTIILPDSTELDRVRERARDAGFELEEGAEHVTLHDPFRNKVVLTTDPSLVLGEN
jgi:catechol 2,3-dioxygenase